MSEHRSGRVAGELDRAIDAALGAMTALTPSTTLRGRVLARIAAGYAEPARPAPGRRLWRALPAAAALGAVAAGVALRGRHVAAPEPAGRTPGRAVLSERAPAVPPAADAPAPASPAPRLSASPPSPRRSARAPRLRRGIPGPALPAVAAEDAAGLPALDPPAPVPPAALAFAETPAPLPLDVPVLRIEPLLDDAGDGLP